MTTNKQDRLYGEFQAALVSVTENVRYEYAVLAAITLLAALLRFYKLGEWSFWFDEIATINRVQAHVNLDTILREWWQPPLSVILTGVVLNNLGVSEWSARLVAAFIAILSIPILYFPIRKLFGTSVGLVATLLLAISPWHVYWSQNARFYTSLLLLYTLATFAFFLAIEKDRPRYLLLFFLLLFLAMGERLLALFLIPVVVCYLLLLQITPFTKPPGFRTRNLLLLLLPGIAGALFDLYRLATTGASHLTHTLETFGGKPVDNPLRIIPLILFDMGVPLAVLAVFSGIYLVLRKSRLGLFFFLGAIVPFFLLAVVSSFAFTADRYIFMTLPCWIILAALAIRELLVQSRNQGRVLVAGVLFILLADAAGAHLMYYQINHGNRLDWRGALSYLERRKESSDIIVSSVPDLASHYMNEPVKLLGHIELGDLGRDGKRYWFLVDSELGWSSPEVQQWIEENGELINVQYLRVRENTSLRIYLVDPQRVEAGR